MVSLKMTCQRYVKILTNSDLNLLIFFGKTTLTLEKCAMTVVTVGREQSRWRGEL